MPDPEEEKYAKVAWSVADVHDLELAQELLIDDEEAKEFLLANQKFIQERMVEAGWNAMETLLQMWAQEKGLC